MSDPEHIALMEAVAKHFFGEPNGRLSNKGELRFGTNGSKSVDLEKGVWFDHETGKGGGPLDLIRNETGIGAPRDCYAWAEREGYWRNGHDSSQLGTVVASYDYTAEDGTLLFQVVRFEPKSFRQRRPDGGGGWVWSVKGVAQVPYRLPELTEAIANGHIIGLTEGEKDADRLWALGVPASCNAGGAGKWRDALTPYFAGADVVIISDNDKAGREHAADVAAKLSGTARRVRMVDLGEVWPQCPEKGDISDWAEQTNGTAEKLYALIDSLPDWRPQPDEPPTIRTGWSFHSFAEPEATPWLIKGFLPETGCGLISGQWGTYKSTIALESALAVMALELFAGRFRVKRPGGVVYFAAEGNAGLCSRLTAIARAHGIDKPLPFAHRADCPELLRPDAVTEITAMIEAAAIELKKRFSVDVVLILVDTVVTAAGYRKPGDENDAALGQRLMATFAAVSRNTGALVIGLDHFGKEIETGTRGSSAKEGHADVVLALMGKKELSGAVSDLCLAIRKQREGEAGLELPFTPITREVGRDEDGDPITRVVIEWAKAGPAIAPVVKNDPWKRKGMRLLKKALMNALAEHGHEIKPHHDGPSVRSVDLEVLRQEFYRGYPAAEESDPAKKASARQKAFRRAVDNAKDSELIGSWEVSGTTYVWLIEFVPRS